MKIKRSTRLGGYGLKDGSGRGWKKGGLGRNRVSASNCRHPAIKKRRLGAYKK